MSADAKSFETTATDAIREIAARQGAALTRYGELLTGFGRGDLKAADFTERAARLAVEETARYWQDMFRLGGAYMRMWGSMLESIDRGRTEPAPATHGTPGRKSGA